MFLIEYTEGNIIVDKTQLSQFTYSCSFWLLIWSVRSWILSWPPYGTAKRAKGVPPCWTPFSTVQVESDTTHFISSFYQ